MFPSSTKSVADVLILNSFVAPKITTPPSFPNLQYFKLIMQAREII